MKTSIIFGLMVTFFAGCFSVHASDTPAQAAARAALEQKLKELDDPQAESVPAPPLRLVVATPARAATNVSVPLPIKAVVIQSPSVPAAKIPVAVAAASVAVVAPTKAQPAALPASLKPGPARAVIKTPVSPVTTQITNEIITIYGTVYKNPTVEKLATNGIIISYQPTGGGLAIAKIYFEDLTYADRQQYKPHKSK
jgi:hypothetical protein